jgi:haloacetate dehalogenase
MDTEDFQNHNHIDCPSLIIWGKDSHTGKVYGDLLKIWRDYVSAELIGGEIDCGHYVIEECPKETADWLVSHFTE